MEIILASNNKHKQKEIASYFQSYKVLLPSQLNIDFQCEEDRDSFVGNSYKKAETLYNMINKMVLADDSGLVVPALNGEPGIFSARYGYKEKGRELSSVEQNKYLLEKMSDIKDRRAYFVCCLVLYEKGNQTTIVEQRFDGHIVNNYNEEITGFGYDPIFVAEGYEEPVACLSLSEKNIISHRGKALKKLQKIIENL